MVVAWWRHASATAAIRGSSSTRCRHWSASGLLRSRSATRMSTTTTGYASIRCWRCSATASRPKRKDCAPLAGKSTMNPRVKPGGLEHAPGDGCSRYHEIGCDREALQDVFVDVFLDAHGKAPREIVLDLDATDDPVHGHQEG